MSIAEIKQLPLAEKLQIMEAIWEDLRAHAEQVAVALWHKQLLDERRRAVEEGREELLEWDAIKDSLGRAQEGMIRIAVYYTMSGEGVAVFAVVDC